jgi:hypothetical protein
MLQALQREIRAQRIEQGQRAFGERLVEFAIGHFIADL